MTQESALPLPPGQIRVGDAWQFGRYVKPFAHPDFGNPLLTRFRLKEWHYSSFATDDWFFAVGLVQLGYVANAFAYLVDRRRPTLPARQFEALSPLGSALRFAPRPPSRAPPAGSVATRAWSSSGWRRSGA